ncbi:MAG: hypothetical protein H6667_14405 [Ardenticatenaceae bacterium]|nr:hypothetical protein [Ardenticatenaceae bacterium]MCB9444247.1 hypothetical protein [Ardenticatenaceae bacterium]
MNIQESLTAVLTQPSTDTLWQLRADLLQAGLPAESSAWRILDKFYAFINELSASMSAHEFSKLATMLDIGAVGGVAIQNLLESDLEPAELWRRIVAGGLSESLMVLASRQYVKGARAGMTGVCQATAWVLYGEFWQLSTQMQPELEPATRRQLIDNLLAVIHDDSVPEEVKIGLNGRLFQILLVQHLSLSTGQIIS